MDTTGKPSREQLEEHFKNSRKYFDDMAQHYKESDPDYYNSMIAPIIRKHRYSDDIGGYTAGRNSLIITAAALLVVLGMSVGIFIFLSPGSPEENPVDKILEKVEGDGTQKTPAPVRETRRTIESEKDPSVEDGTSGDLEGDMSNYEKGVFYYDQNAYDKALEYFGNVKPDDPDYNSSQKYIKKIKDMPEDERTGEKMEGEPPQVNPMKK